MLAQQPSRLRRRSGASNAAMGRVTTTPRIATPLRAAAPPTAVDAPATASRQPQQQQPRPTPPQPAPSPAAAAGAAEPDVPSTLPALLSAFLREPSILLACALIAATAAARLALPPPSSAAEPALCLAAVALWSVSEWLIHRHLLHPDVDEGSAKQLDPLREALRATHAQHHARPYLHVSVDGPGLVAAFMLGTGALWLAGFAVCGAISSSSSSGGGGLAIVDGGLSGSGGGGALSLLLASLASNPLLFSALAAYWSAGLLYEFVHFAVHTRYVPRGQSWFARYLRHVRRHHILHHCRSEAHWLAFTVPQVDALFGTLPAAGGGGGDGARLPAMTPMAKRAAQSWRQGASNKGP